MSTESHNYRMHRIGHKAGLPVTQALDENEKKEIRENLASVLRL
jgi:hypothetical protein